MAREELKWQNIDADDLPAAVKKSFDAMVEAEATFKADLVLKDEGHMPEDKFLVMSRKGKRSGGRVRERATRGRRSKISDVQNQISVRLLLAEVRISSASGHPCERVGELPHPCRLHT
jgi:hypothetical protein